LVLSGVILEEMSIRPSACVLFATLALLAVSCAGSDGKQAVSTNTRTATSPSSTTASYAFQAPVLSDQCPSKPPTASPKALNAGVSGLEKKLVPIAALTVRVCRYPKAVSPFVYDDSAAAQFEAETNRLPALALSGRGVSCGAGAPTYVVRFSGAAQQVDVVDFCGEATNGAFAADPTAKWVGGLQTPTMGTPPAPPKCPARQTQPSFNLTYCGPTPGPGNGLGPSGECTGHETAPPCGPGMVPNRYYPYTLPGRCDGRLILNGSRWRSGLPPPMPVPDLYVWVSLNARGEGPGFISAQGAVDFRRDTGQPVAACADSLSVTPTNTTG
jgi:hypothetical protein